VSTLPFEDLETAYELIAKAIDAAGEAKEAQFFTRLALILAHESGDLARFRNALKAALDGLSDHTE
jgi:hypothetical protein